MAPFKVTAEKKKQIEFHAMELASSIVDSIFICEESEEEMINEALKDEAVEEKPKKERKTKPAKVAPVEEEKLPEQSFSIFNAPKNQAEAELYRKQWKALGERQDEYLSGNIDSLGNTIASVEEEEPKASKKDVTKEESKKGESKKLTIDDIRAVLRDVSLKFDSDKAVELLSKYDAKKVSDLKESDYAIFYREATNVR